MNTQTRSSDFLANPEMKADDVVELVRLLETNGISTWVDGGWGIDALLGEQTRPHNDVDIALWHKDVPRLRELLQQWGYRDMLRDDTSAFNFVLGDQTGHLIDVHSFTFDEAGNNVFGIAYQLGDLTGTGTIAGHTVKCIAAASMVNFHTGYELDEKDYRDVMALCQRFNIILPTEYSKFITISSS